MQTLLKGFAMGFCIAAPVGPIGLLCIRRSIRDGRAAGFVSGLGAATADSIFGLVAALGLSAVTSFLLEHRTAIQLFGGGFLVYLGVTLMRVKPTLAVPASGQVRTLAAAYGSTLALTLANPATILAFVAIFAGLGIGVNTSGLTPAAMLVGGVFLGSAAWWLLLSTGASWLGNKVGAHRLHVVNVASGSVIAAFGVWQVLTLFRPG